MAAGCTAIANDLHNGFEWGTNPERLTRKADARRHGRLPSAINGFLWRAALDTVGYMPLEMADAKTGRIVTNWYAAPGSADERTRLIVEVLDPNLRRDTVRVSVLRQVRQGEGWEAAPSVRATAQDIEETILAKARALRQGSLELKQY